MNEHISFVEYETGKLSMPVIEVQGELARHDLISPDLEMLRPTERRYTAMLLQPGGPIFANQHRIGNLNVPAASLKGRKLLELARTNLADLVVTPEYFLPWAVLQTAILEAVTPAEGALWVLGCESISSEQLQIFSESVGQVCKVIHEPIEELQDHGSLFDPVVLLFRTQDTQGINRLVALIQFKTFPSRDNVFFEEGILKRGTAIYKFRGRSGHLSTAAVICSDAFSLSNGLVNELIDRSTLIHIQLNQDPRNTAYRAYRAKTFETDPKGSDCHIVCLNWAQAVVQHGDGNVETPWNNIAGSAWYCPGDGCSTADDIVVPNHEKGLYYTCLSDERRHALLFHYDEAVFELLVPKLMTTGQAVLANRNGPSLVHRYTWSALQNWEEAVHAPDAGFANLLAANPDAGSALNQVAGIANPLGIERVLALTAGAIAGLDRWHMPNNIDSCQMQADEVVLRITVAQDTAAKASDFRYGRLTRIAQLRHDIINTPRWPAQVDGMSTGATIAWSMASPHFNVMTADGKPTLIVHLGESPPPRFLENVPDMLYQLLRRVGGAHEKRFCVVYSRFGEQKFAAIPGLTRFDDALEDATDILAVQPVEGSENQP
jgi:hypothetical protein